MAPCSNVRFTYRGHTPGGNQLARLRMVEIIP